ncbi:MAG: hypothetical protein L3J51_00300 [Cocleimonas sp.]|nr:hypothetical protein [Cocleimonas sp.]
MMYEIAKYKGNDFLFTKSIRAKGFSRELKSILLKREFVLGDTQEYEKVLSALNIIMNSTDADDFICSGRFSRWWRGLSLPEPKKQIEIDKAFNGLANKWFGRSKFTNRFQLYLSSIDFKTIKKQYAQNEAIESLGRITEDWAPKISEDGCAYLSISGPSSRAGYRYSNTHSRITDSRQHEQYDLTIGAASYAGIDIPKFIAGIYQRYYFGSIIPYMFCLLCTNTDNESNYKNDLLLDFLTALNCIDFILKDERSFMINDKNIKIISSLSTYVTSSFYTDYFSSKKAKEIEKRRRINPKYDDLPSLNKVNQPLNTLAETFGVILQEYSTEKELSQFYRDYHAKNVDSINKVSDITQTTFSLLDDMRNYYYKLFERAGFNKSEAINKILTPFAAAKAGSREVIHYSSSRRNPLSPSPY